MKVKLFILFLTVALFLNGLIGCGALIDEERRVIATYRVTEPQKDGPPKAIKKKITVGDLFGSLNDLPAELKVKFTGPKGLESFMYFYISKKLMIEEARNEGITVAPDEIMQYKKQMGIPQIQDSGKIYGMDQGDTEALMPTDREIEESILEGRMMEKIFKDITVTDSEAQLIYDATKEFYQANQVGVLYIGETKRENLEELRQQVLQGKSFKELLAQRSLTPIKPEDIKPAYLTVDELGSPLKETVEKLSPGEVSEVLQLDPNTFALIQLVDRRTVTPFSEIADRLKQKILVDKRGERQKNFFVELRRKYDLVLYPENLPQQPGAGAEMEPLPQQAQPAVPQQQQPVAPQQPLQ